MAVALPCWAAEAIVTIPGVATGSVAVDLARRATGTRSVRDLVGRVARFAGVAANLAEGSDRAGRPAVTAVPVCRIATLVIAADLIVGAASVTLANAVGVAAVAAVA